MSSKEDIEHYDRIPLALLVGVALAQPEAGGVWSHAAPSGDIVPQGGMVSSGAHYSTVASTFKVSLRSLLYFRAALVAGKEVWMGPLLPGVVEPGGSRTSTPQWQYCGC